MCFGYISMEWWYLCGLTRWYIFRLFMLNPLFGNVICATSFLNNSNGFCRTWLCEYDLRWNKLRRPIGKFHFRAITASMGRVTFCSKQLCNWQREVETNLGFRAQWKSSKSWKLEINIRGFGSSALIWMCIDRLETTQGFLRKHKAPFFPVKHPAVGGHNLVNNARVDLLAKTLTLNNEFAGQLFSIQGERL